MDAIDKAIKKFSTMERAWVKDILRKVNVGQLQGLDIKKLKGWDDIFRVRKGDIRVIYRKQNGRVSLLAVGRKKEKTYYDF